MVKIALLPGKVATPVVCVQLHLVLPPSKAPPLPMEQPDAQWELGCLKRAACSCRSVCAHSVFPCFAGRFMKVTAKLSAQLDVPLPHLGTGPQVGWMGAVHSV